MPPTIDSSRVPLMLRRIEHAKYRPKNALYYKIKLQQALEQQLNWGCLTAVLFVTAFWAMVIYIFR